MTGETEKTTVPLQDGLVNLKSRLGSSADRQRSNVYVVPTLTQAGIESAYRTSWLTRKVHDLIPFEMTRAGRDWKADAKQIKALTETETRLKLWSALKEALTLGRLHGGGAIILGVRQGIPEEPLVPEKIKKGDLRYLYVVSRHQLQVVNGEFETDPESDHFGQPKLWELNSGKGVSSKIHPSRVITFHGAPLPKGALSISEEEQFWGDPLLLSIQNAIENADTVQAAVATLLHEMKHDIISIPGLTEQIATEGAEKRLAARVEAIALFKSMFNITLLDGGDEEGNNGEELETRELSFTQHPELLQKFLGIVAGASDIPITRLLGESPGGMQSTGKGEQRDFNRMIGSKQTDSLTPALALLDPILIPSATGTQQNDEITSEYGALEEPDPKEDAEIEKEESTSIKTILDTNLIPQDAFAKAVANRLIESGRWPGLDKAIEESKQELGEPPEPAVTPDTEKVVKEMEAQGAITEDQAVTLLTDASPRSLYVSRPVLNAAEVRKWAKAQGFGSVIPAKDMHVTIISSATPVDWMKISADHWGDNENGEITIAPGGPRIVDFLGDKGGVVLFFAASDLSWRRQSMVRKGAEDKFDDYQPHITLTYAGEKLPNLKEVEPYRGKIRLGPERFEEVNDDWAEGVLEN